MAIFSAAVASVTSWFTGLSLAAQIGVRVVAGLALNAIGKALAGKPDAPKVQKPGIKGQIQQGADLPRAVLVGRTATAGSLVFHNTSEKGRWYVRVTALSDLPVRGLRKMWVDGKEVTINWADEDPYLGAPMADFQYSKTETKMVRVPHQNEQGDFTTRIVPQPVEKTVSAGYVKFFDGTQTEADERLYTSYSSDGREWTPDHVGRGVAYAVVYFRNTKDFFTGLPELLFEVDGINVADPETGGQVASDHPGLICYNLLKGLDWQGVPLYGPQSPAPLNAAEWAAAVAIEREAAPGSAGMTDPEKLETYGTTDPRRYFAGMEIALDRPIAEVIEDISAASNGQVSFVGDRYAYRVGDPSAAAMSFTDDDILTTLGRSAKPFRPLAETVNAVTATYPDPQSGWQNQTAPILLDAALEAEDGDRRLPTNVELSAVPWPEQVQRLMQAALAEARQARVHRIPLPARFDALEVNDHVSWTSPRNGYVDKLFRVDGVTPQSDGDVVLDLVETDPENYAGWEPGTDYTPLPPVAPQIVQLPSIPVDDFAVEATPVSDGADVDRRPGLFLSWSDPDNAAVTSGVYEVRVTQTGALAASGVIEDVAAEGLLLAAPLLPAQDYAARMRWVAEGYLTPWSDLTSAVTGDLRLQQIDLADVLSTKIDAAFGRHDDALDAASGTIAELRDAITGNIAPLQADVPLHELVELTIENLDLQIDRIANDERALADVYDRLIELQGRWNDTRNILTEAGVYVSSDTGEVRIAGVDSAQDRVAKAEVRVDAVAAEVQLRATVEYVETKVSEALLDPSQIPVLDDLTLRVTGVEVDLSAETGRIDSLSETLTVDGGIVTMATVTSTLDSLQGQVLDRVVQSEFDGAEQRITAAEQEIEAFGDAASVAESVEVSRRLASDAPDLVDLNIIDLWGRWKEGLTLRESTAQGDRELRADVRDGLTAEAQERLALKAQADMALAQLEQTLSVLAAEDIAQAELITQVQADLANAETAIGGNASGLSDLTARVTVAEGAITSQAELINQVQADLTSAEGDIAGNASGLSSLDTRVTDAEGAITSQGTAITQVQAGLTTAQNTADGAVSDAAAAQADADANGSAIASLDTRVTNAEGQITSQGTAITQLQSDVTDADAGISANASALNTLTTRVTAAEGVNSTQSSQIVQITNDLNTAEGAIAGNASGLSNVTTRVNEAEGDITAQGTLINQLQAGVADANTGIDGNASAITALDVRVTGAEDDVAAQAGQISTLQSGVNNNLAQIAILNGTKVDAAGAVAAIDAEISASFADVSAMAEASLFAQSTVNGITAGYVLRLNGQGVFEAVSVGDGTGGTTTTARLAADYVQITGIAQIETAVLDELFAESIVAARLTVTNAMIEDLAVDTLQIADNAVTVPVHIQSGQSAVASSTTTWVDVLQITIDRAPGVATQIDFGGQLDGIKPTYTRGFGAVATFRIVRLTDNAVIAANLSQATGYLGARTAFMFSAEDPTSGALPTTYKLQVQRVASAQLGKTPRVIMPWMRAKQHKR